jgi:hypothetical protein
LHGEVDQVQQDKERIKEDLKAVLEKLEIIEEAVKNTREAFHEESEPVSPAAEAPDATFSFFGSPPTDKVEKHLTLKQLASVCTNSNLVRIVEVCQLIKEKLILVNQQTSQLAERITKARSNNFLAIVRSPNLVSQNTIKALGGDSKQEPESSGHQDSKPPPNITPTWEQWCNSKYQGSKKAPMDIDG